MPEWVDSFNLPEPLYNACVGRPRKLGWSNYMAVTNLTNPPRILQLVARHDHLIKKEVVDQLWLVLGNAVHYVLDKAPAVAAWQERWLRMVVPIWDQCMVVTGRFDVYDHKLRSLDDYKVASVWQYLKGTEGDEPQLNVYAYMFEKRFHLPVEQIRIIPIYRDWSRNKAHEKNYPSYQCEPKMVRRWPNDVVMRYVRTRLWEHVRSKDLPDDELPECTPEERWDRPSQWAVMKKGRKSAIKFYDSEEDSLTGIDYWSKKHSRAQLYVEHREGIRVRCENYCDGAPFCNVFADYKKRQERRKTKKQLERWENDAKSKKGE